MTTETNDAEAAPQSAKAATAATAAANAHVAATLPLDQATDRANAERGLLAAGDGIALGANGWPVWNQPAFAFLADDAPPTANPSLWRQGQLNAIHGLFEVCPGIYQVRGYDLSNMTLVAGDTGWIIIDPLSAEETAATALALANHHLGARPVIAVFYTHSHVDHFGGVRGVVDEADVLAGRVPVLAPDGFLEAAVKENVVAGNAMTRRAVYMYGGMLPNDPTGHIDCGLGKASPAGTMGLIAPTDVITETGEQRVIDGVRIEFQMTPGTEAPSEMNFWFPDHRALCMAENCSATLHNVYTPRGAEIRDALSWSKYIIEAIDRYGERADVVFASHHWPRWGHDDLNGYLANQADLYRWIHDQTMRMANHGATPLEIAEALEAPPGLHDDFALRGYYGTLSHNAKAVYQRYLGWFDANPAHLHPLPPVESATRYVAAMGGIDAVVDLGHQAFAEGDYRWVAELVNHAVFADPHHLGARALQADALEQLGYQAESGPWRDFYLTGAKELRGAPQQTIDFALHRPEMLRAMTTDMLIDFMAVRVNGPRAVAEAPIAFTLTFTDVGQSHDVVLRNGVLHHLPPAEPPLATRVTTTRAAMVDLLTAASSIDGLHADGQMVTIGDPDPLARLVGLLDTFSLLFAVIEP